MLGTKEAVRSLILPMEAEHALLPNSAVAEIIGFRKPEEVDGKPEWYLGDLEWRGVKIPMVSFQGLNTGSCSGTTKGARVAIMNPIGNHDKLKFYAIATSGIPHLANLTDGDVMLDANESATGDATLQRVTIGNITAAIPDMEKIEAELLKVI